jgi:hypothetical protein
MLYCTYINGEQPSTLFRDTQKFRATTTISWLENSQKRKYKNTRKPWVLSGYTEN